MGEKLKQKRIERGYSQQQLSNITGINVWTIRQYEQGRRDIDLAQANILAVLADALDCTMEELMEKEYRAKKRKIRRSRNE